MSNSTRFGVESKEVSNLPGVEPNGRFDPRQRGILDVERGLAIRHRIRHENGVLANQAQIRGGAPGGLSRDPGGLGMTKTPPGGSPGLLHWA